MFAEYLMAKLLHSRLGEMEEDVEPAGDGRNKDSLPADEITPEQGAAVCRRLVEDVAGSDVEIGKGQVESLFHVADQLRAVVAGEQAGMRRGGRIAADGRAALLPGRLFPFFLLGFLGRFVLAAFLFFQRKGQGADRFDLLALPGDVALAVAAGVEEGDEVDRLEQDGVDARAHRDDGLGEQLGSVFAGGQQDQIGIDAARLLRVAWPMASNEMSVREPSMITMSMPCGMLRQARIVPQFSA